jgi:hypothetical protein
MGMKTCVRTDYKLDSLSSGVHLSELYSDDLCNPVWKKSHGCKVMYIRAAAKINTRFFFLPLLHNRLNTRAMLLIYLTTLALCVINQSLKQETIFSSLIPLQCAAGNIFAPDGLYQL